MGGRKTAQRQRWAGWSALLRAGRMAFLKNPKRLLACGIQPRGFVGAACVS